MSRRFQTQRSSGGPRRSRVAPRGGMVLLLVLVVVAMLTLAGFTFADWMFTERQGVQVTQAEAQARAAAESAVELLRVAVQPSSAARAVGGNLQDDPARFCNVALRFGEVSDDRPRFTVLSPRLDPEATGIRFGLDNQSSRLNLHAVLQWEQAQPGAGAAALSALPGMAPELVDALLDWIDADDQPRPQGAESDYYSGLETPYVPTNAVPAQLEDLLRVKGMTTETLLGRDANRNGVLQPGEQRTGLAPAATAQDAAVSPRSGLSSLLTVCSAEANRTADGAVRIDLNQPDLRSLHRALVEALDEEAARFIVAYRQFGPSPAFLATRQRPTGPVDLQLPAQFFLHSPWDLIDAKVLVKSAAGGQQLILESPWHSGSARAGEPLDRLLDATTTVAAPVIVGRVNVLLAPAAVLRALPGMDEAQAEAIVAKRPTADSAGPAGQSRWSWLLEGGLMPLEKLRQLAPLWTVGGDVHSAQVVGFVRPDGPRFRAEVWLDATQRPSRVLLWKDLSRLGPGYPYELLSLHSGPALPGF